MAKFTDRLGREWALEITMASADQVEQDLGIDLLRWIESPEAADNRTVFKIVASLLAEEIAGRGLDLAAFKKGFDGPTLERAGQALVEALLFFCHPQKVALAALPKLRQTKEDLEERAAARIEALDSRSLGGLSPASSASTPAP